MMCALLLWTVSSGELQDYFSFDWLKYVVSNLVFLNFLHPNLPGVFETNKWQAVNGALWTLKIEVMFYAAVPIIVYLFSRFGRLAVMITFYTLSAAYAWFMISQGFRSGSEYYLILARQLPGQMTYFIAGGFVYCFLPLFERRLPYFFRFSVIRIMFYEFLLSLTYC